MVDAVDSKSTGREAVRVRAPPRVRCDKRRLLGWRGAKTGEGFAVLFNYMMGYLTPIKVIPTVIIVILHRFLLILWKVVTEQMIFYETRGLIVRFVKGLNVCYQRISLFLFEAAVSDGVKDL